MHVWVAPVGREQRSAAHELLLALAAELVGEGAVLRHDAGGRPWVESMPGTTDSGRVWASVSHGRGLVAVAASVDGPVGVDVETRRPFGTAGLARRWFDPAELAWLADRPDPLAGFLQLWTAKEAVGKALGTGLRNSGLQRRMPFSDGLVPGVEPALALLHLPLTADPLTADPLTADSLTADPVTADAVLAVAVFADAREVVLSETAAVAGHGAARRSAAASRTSFPVVVRGN